MQRLISKVLSRRVRTMRSSSLKNDNLTKQCELMYRNSTVFEIKKEIAESCNLFVFKLNFYS